MITGMFYKLGTLLLGLFDYLPAWNLPSQFYAGLDDFIYFMGRLDGLLPAWPLLKAFCAVLAYFIVVRTFNFLSDTLALLRGSGNPHI